jgi:hypothetical protein
MNNSLKQTTTDAVTRRSSLSIVEPVIWNDEYEYTRERRISIGNIDDMHKNTVKKMFENSKMNEPSEICARQYQRLDAYTNDLDVIEERDNRNTYGDIEDYSDTSGETASLNSKSTFNDESGFCSIRTSKNLERSGSNGSLNSEEGYYSHQDTSISTLVDDVHQSTTETADTLFNNTKRTCSNPDIANSYAFARFQSSQTCTEFDSIECKANPVENLLDRKQEGDCSNSKLTTGIKNSISDYAICSNLSRVLSLPQDHESINTDQVKLDGLSTTNLRDTWQCGRSASQYSLNLIPYQPNAKASLQRRPNVYNSNIEEMRKKVLRLRTQEFEQTQESKRFLLIEAFGLRFLLEAEHFFAPGVRELITKFEKRKQLQARL